MNYKINGLIIIISLSLGCSGGSGRIFDPTYWSEPFKGITVTNNWGKILKVDNSDWCIPDLQSSEKFGFLPAAPNPAEMIEGEIQLLFYLRDDSKIKIYIKDRNLNTIAVLVDTLTHSGLHYITWDFTNSHGECVIPGIYRCYMTADNYKCHGDIWIK